MCAPTLPRAGCSTRPMCSATMATAAPCWRARGSTACATPVNHEVDRVLVTAPDRLARNSVHQMVLLGGIGGHIGCAAEFLDRPMSDDPHDHSLLQIRGTVAEYERTLIAERMRCGPLAKLRAGRLLLWTYAP